MKIHNLYRCFDENDNLLYVGISWSAPLRFRGHSVTSPWWGDVVRVSLERYQSRPIAEAAEQQAIRTEAPRYNAQHAVEAPVKREPDPAQAQWQVLSARFNKFGTWSVDLLPPGGSPEISINNLPDASDLVDAVQQAVDEGKALLAQFTEEQQ